MALKITYKESFLDDFLIPISKITENCVLNIEPGKISSLVASTDSTIITYSEYKDPNITETLKLNLPDVKKFCKLISCIDSDFNLDINSNNLSYKSPNIRFKYHLYDDGIILSPPLNLEKIKLIEMDGKFSIDYNNLNQLLKGSTFTHDLEKFYITINSDNSVFAEITDKNKHNSNSFGLNIATNFEGTCVKSEFPFKFDLLQIITQYKASIYNVELSSKLGVFVFTIEFDNILTKFIVSALKD